MKKQKGKTAKKHYEEKGLVPEFVRMSRNGGIGFDYYTKNRDEIYKHDKLYIATPKGTRTTTPPAYFDRLYYKHNPKRLYDLKQKRTNLIIHRDELLKHQYPNIRPELHLYNQFIDNAKKTLFLKNKRNQL